MWCGQRVGVGLTPTHREDVHRFNVHDELWSWALQACGESRQQVKTGVNNKDTEEGGEIRAALGWGRWGWGDTVLKLNPKPMVFYNRYKCQRGTVAEVHRIHKKGDLEKRYFPLKTRGRGRIIGDNCILIPTEGQASFFPKNGFEAKEDSPAFGVGTPRHFSPNTKQRSTFNQQKLNVPVKRNWEGSVTLVISNEHQSTIS